LSEALFADPRWTPMEIKGVPYMHFVLKSVLFNVKAVENFPLIVYAFYILVAFYSFCIEDRINSSLRIRIVGRNKNIQ
jgi:hypothetical protein